MARYDDCIVKYGIISVCKLLQEYERSEKYEECQLILLAIRGHNASTKQNLPTTYSGCIELLKSQFEYAEYGYMLSEVSDDVNEIKRYISR